MNNTTHKNIKFYTYLIRNKWIYLYLLILHFSNICIKSVIIVQHISIDYIRPRERNLAFIINL